MNKNSIRSQTFIIELLNPPMKHSIEKTNELFSKLKSYYANCNRPAEGVTEFSSIANKSTNETKKCIIKGDRIIIINDFTNSSVESFWDESDLILREIVGFLQIPLFFFRNYIVRLIANPLNEADSRIFLGNMVCGLDEAKLAPFKRPIHGIGMRFVFPAIKQIPNEFNVRVESFLQNTKHIFIENQARFLNPLQIQDNHFEMLKKELLETYNFLKENVADFLMQYNKEN